MAAGMMSDGDVRALALFGVVTISGVPVDVISAISVITGASTRFSM